MKKYILLLIIPLILCVIIFLRKTEKKDASPLSKEVKKEILEYYDNGQIKEELILSKDESNGNVITYYENGKISATSEIKDLIPHGIHKEYYENGQLKIEGHWKDGMQEGVSKEYYENGQLKTESNWKNDKQEGVSKEYDENGQLKTESNWKNDKQDGEVKFYYESGELETKQSFKNGQADGPHIWYYKNGKIEQELNWQYGKEHGLWKIYYINGQIKQELSWQNGQLIYEKCWDKNNIPIQCGINESAEEKVNPKNNNYTPQSINREEYNPNRNKDSFLPIPNINGNGDIKNVVYTNDLASVSMSVQELQTLAQDMNNLASTRGYPLMAFPHPQSIEDATFKVFIYSVKYFDDEGSLIHHTGPWYSLDYMIRHFFRSAKSGELISFVDIKAHKYINGRYTGEEVIVMPLNITVK